MKDRHPLVSIIMPVYNTQDFVTESIESCLCQSYSNIEIIAVNDGSQDNSLDVMSGIALNNSRLRIFSTDNRGVVAARNLAISKAQGEYICFVDSDDVIMPEAVSELVGVAESKEVDMVLSGLILRSSKSDTPLLRSVSKSLTREALLKEMLLYKFPGSLYAILFRRSLFEGITAPSDLKIGEDFYTICNILLKYNPEFEILHEPTYIYVQDRGCSAVNTHSDKMALQQIYFSKSIDVLFRTYPVVKSQLVPEISYFHLHNLLIYADKSQSKPDKSIVWDCSSRFYVSAGSYIGWGMGLKLIVLGFSFTAYKILERILEFVHRLRS